jgi:hypothetical protein
MNVANPWEERFRAVARAQSRYLWILLVVGIFFLALDRQIEGARVTQAPVALPVLGISVDAVLVWSFAPALIGFLCSVAMRTLRAQTTAAKKLALDEDGFEAADVAPTAIDFFVYYPGHWWLSWVALTTYPIYFTLLASKATWLLTELYGRRFQTSMWLVTFGLGAPLVVAT